jgi:hypothetical protein
MFTRSRFIVQCVVFALGGMTLAQTVSANHPEVKRNHWHGAAPATTFEVLETKEIDVTGDKQPESISLLGKRKEAGSSTFDSIRILVRDPKNKKDMWIRLAGGSDPKIQFCDFNGDKIAGIWVSAATGGSEGTSNNYLYSVVDDVPKSIPVPEPLHISGALQDNYSAQVVVEEQNKSYAIDLKERKKLYDESGVYKKGKLLKPTSVMVNAYHELKPQDIDKDGVCELLGVQRISGISNADTIALATSVWKLDANKWKLTDANVIKK